MVVSVATRTYLELAERLRAATSAKERAALVAETARLLNVKVQSVYRSLKTVGYDSGRKPRKDKGTSAIDTTALERVSEHLAQAVNKRGRLNAPVKLVQEIAEKHDALPKVSYGHLCRRLRQEGLGPRHMRAPKAGIVIKSKHPNHVWYFDISIAIQWYFRDESGKKLDLYHDAGARIYEGKRELLDPKRRVIHRFCVTDHATGAYYVQYYYSAGESAEDVVDFLYRAMAAKKWAGAAMPFRGVPARLVMDQGSANKSALVQNLLKALDIKPHYHKAGNAKASGSVESWHRHWQELFESEQAMSDCRAENVEQLCELAEKVAAVHQSDPRRKHTRTGRTRMAAWLDITTEQLVEVPSREVFFELARTNEREGTLTSQYHLRANGRRWELTGDNLYPGMKVLYRISPFAKAGIFVTTLEGKALAALELTKDKYGFQNEGRVFGWDDAEHKGATAPLNAAQKVLEKVESGERNGRIPGLFADIDQEVAKYEYLHRKGTAHTLATAASAEVFDIFAVREEVIRKLGRGLTPDEADWWRAQVGAGITAVQIAELLVVFTQPAGKEAVR